MLARPMSMGGGMAASKMAASNGCGATRLAGAVTVEYNREGRGGNAPDSKNASLSLKF
jgi:hypothetical protein